MIFGFPAELRRAETHVIRRLVSRKREICFCDPPAADISALHLVETCQKVDSRCPSSSIPLRRPSVCETVPLERTKEWSRLIAAMFRPIINFGRVLRRNLLFLPPSRWERERQSILPSLFSLECVTR